MELGLTVLRLEAGSTPLFVGSLAVGFPTSVMSSLWSGEDLTRERWFYARGWFMIAVLTGDTCNIVYYCFLVLHIMDIHS